MAANPELIVMLTKDDMTVENAPEVFERCKGLKARYWGFKEEPLPLATMQRLYDRMRECGKTTVMEIVLYDQAASLEAAKMAIACGCDIVMGTAFSDAINVLCLENGVKYLPFVGTIMGRPSVLEGSLEDMLAEARGYIEKGAYGIDLLGYRYTGDAVQLNRRFVEALDAPVCLAGSVNSFQRLDEVKQAGPWAFTIGSAFFDEAFGHDGIASQIDTVCSYMEA